MKSSKNTGIRDLKLSSSSRLFHWALANKLVIVLTLMISLLLLLLFRPGFRPEEFTAPATGFLSLCRNNDNKSTTNEEKNALMSGDKHGGMVDVLLSALETDDKPTIRFYKTATFPAFPMFVCENCKCDICSQTLSAGYFSPIETALFRHILGNGVCGRAAPNNLLVDVGANVGYFSAYASVLGCRVVSFEPNEHPRRYLEASAALHDPLHLSWKVYPVAIGKEEKKVHFTEEGSWGFSHITKRKLMQVRDLEVQVVLLDTIVKEDVLLLKIDTEGYEASVIAGSHNVLKNYNVQNVVVEVKNYNEHVVRDFLFDLKQDGRFTHVYNYFEEYDKPGMDLSTFDLHEATMYDVTDVVMNKRYEQELKHEDFWFCKKPFLRT
jgi:FkbM family methyltransferase